MTKKASAFLSKHSYPILKIMIKQMGSNVLNREPKGELLTWQSPSRSKQNPKFRRKHRHQRKPHRRKQRQQNPHRQKPHRKPNPKSSRNSNLNRSLFH